MEPASIADKPNAASTVCIRIPVHMVETIHKVTKAITKGQKWVASHSAAEIADAIASFFPDTDKDLLTKAMQSHIDVDAWNTDSVMKKEAFDRLQDVISEAGELKEKVDFHTLVDNSFAEKAK